MIKQTAAAFLLITSLQACVGQDVIIPQPPRQTDNSTSRPSPQPPRPQPQPQPEYRPPVRNAIGPGLGQLVFDQWRSFPGKTGIAVERIDGGGLVGRRLDDMFPQQSVSKVWVALAVFDRIDKGELSLDQEVRVTFNDFTMFQSIIKREVENEGPKNATIRRLLELAVIKSDNTANDKLMWLVGGPQAIRDTLAAKGISGIRFGPGERELQSQIAGFSWRQEYGPGNAWFTARRKISNDRRRSSMRAYIADPMDGATPRAMVRALSRLAREELLSARSTRQMLDLMARVTSGPRRLKSGVPSNWQFGHKTGTGQTLGGWGTGYNDVGIMTAPDGTRYAVAVLLAETTASIPKRWKMMQTITSGVARYHYR